MKNPLYWSKLEFLSQIFATIRQLKKKHWAGGIPKISGPRGQRPRELVTLVGMHPPDPMMALPDVNKKNHHSNFSNFYADTQWVPDGYHIKTKFNASGTRRVSQ
jgi:hypothetical protein